MTREVDFGTGTVVTPEWLDAVQEMMSGLALNFVLSASGTNKVRVVAGSGKDQVSANINGQMRYMSTTVETGAIAGGAATYNIFATADTADRDFALVATTLAAPAGVTNYRKVGEADWSGTAITAVRSMAGPSVTYNPTFTGTVTVPTPAAGSDAAVAATTEWVRDYIASLNIYAPGDIKAVATAAAPTGWLACYGQAVNRTTYAALFAAIGTTYGAGDGSTTFNLPDLRGRVIAGLDNMGGVDAARLDWANTLGNAGGAQYHTLIASQMPSHSHTVNSHNHAGTTTNAGSHNHSGNTGTASSNHGHTGGTQFHIHGGNIANRSISSGGTYNVALYGGGAYGDVNINGADHYHAITVSTVGDHAHGVYAEAPGTTGAGSDGAHNNMQPTMVLNYCIKT